MRDQTKARKQSPDELAKMRLRVAELERSELERRRIEAELRASEEKYRNLVNGINDGYLVVSGNRIVFANQVSAERTGIPVEELIGRSVLEALTPESGARAREIYEGARHGGPPPNSEEFLIQRGDGTEHPVEIRFKETMYEGQPAYALLISDITERKQMEEALRESEQRYRQLFEGISDAVVVYGSNGRFLDCNEVMLRRLGYSRDEFLCLTPEEIVHPDFQLLVEVNRKEIWSGEATVAELMHRAKDGTAIHVEINACRIEYRGEPAILAVVRDITERKRVEEALRESEEKWRSLTEYSPDHIMLLDRDATILFMNRTVPGLTVEEVVGTLAYDYMPPESDVIQREALEQVLATGDSGQYAVEYMSADGDTRVFESHIGPMREDGRVVGAIVSTRDVTARKKAEQALRESEERYRTLSITDELTGLHNRRHFYEVLEMEIHRTQRYGRSFSVVMLDLDGFKEYNDRFGHASGDSVLRSLARTLRSELRKADMAFRYGGDEFTIILPGTNASRTRKVVDRVRSRWLHEPKLRYPLLENPLGFSAGIAQCPENADTSDGLVFLADTALYHAKRGGRYGTKLAAELGAVSTDFMSLATLDQVYALAATVDARDPHTYGHSKRVADIAEMIGKAIGLSQRQLADLHAAALLHDIGKVGVPDSILTKPGVLTRDERSVIEKHCDEGVKVIGYIKELVALMPMVRHHHEWYDGTGYPDGLKGEGIPVGARIIAVADAYDTMTTSRPYRDMVSQQEAIEELRRCSGSQFDPELVEKFCCAINRSMEQIQTRFTEIEN